MRLLKGWFGRRTAALERPPERPYPIEAPVQGSTGTSEAMVLETGRYAVGVVERSAVRGERWIHARSIVPAR